MLLQSYDCIMMILFNEHVTLVNLNFFAQIQQHLTRCTLKIKIIIFVLRYIMCDNFPIESVAC